MNTLEWSFEGRRLVGALGSLRFVVRDDSSQSRPDHWQIDLVTNCTLRYEIERPEWVQWSGDDVIMDMECIGYGSVGDCARQMWAEFARRNSMISDLIIPDPPEWQDVSRTESAQDIYNKQRYDCALPG